MKSQAERLLWARDLEREASRIMDLSADCLTGHPRAATCPTCHPLVIAAQDLENIAARVRRDVASEPDESLLAMAIAAENERLLEMVEGLDKENRLLRAMDAMELVASEGR